MNHVYTTSACYRNLGCVSATSLYLQGSNYAPNSFYHFSFPWIAGPTSLLVTHSLSDVCILTGRGICQVRTTEGGTKRCEEPCSERERGREKEGRGTNPPIVIRHHVQCARSPSSNNERIRKGIKEGIRIPDNATRLPVLILLSMLRRPPKRINITQEPGWVLLTGSEREICLPNGSHAAGKKLGIKK